MAESSPIEIVGDSSIWHLWEERHGLCHGCSGDGQLAATDRAAYHPEQFPDELIPCPTCGGTGRARP